MDIKLNKINVIISSLLLFLCTGGYFYYNHYKDEKDQSVSSIITENLIRSDISQDVLSTGTLYAAEQVSVGAEVSGQINKLYIKIGSKVKKGQLLAEIDSITQMNNLVNAQSLVNSNKASLESKKIVLENVKKKNERQKSLLNDDATTKETLEDSEMNYKTALYDVKMAEANLEQSLISLKTAKKNLANTKIISPIDATVLSIPVSEGQTVNANQSTPTIATIADLSKIKIKAQISESDVSKIKEGMKLSFNILGNDKIYYGVIDSIDPAPTTISDNGTISSAYTTAIYYYANIYVDNSKNDLKMYMTANIKINTSEKKNVLLVSSSALIKEGNDYILKVLKDNKIINKKVKIGINNKIKAEVISGVLEGDKIVLSNEKAENKMRGPMF